MQIFYSKTQLFIIISGNENEVVASNKPRRKPNARGRNVANGGTVQSIEENTLTQRRKPTANAVRQTPKRKIATTTTPRPEATSITPPPPTTPDPGGGTNPIFKRVFFFLIFYIFFLNYLYILLIDFKCEDEGFFPNPRDCKKYFWCLDSGPSNLGIVAHQFTCPSGLVFNKLTDSCDYTRNVICNKIKDTTTTA